MKAGFIAVAAMVVPALVAGSSAPAASMPPSIRSVPASSSHHVPHSHCPVFPGDDVWHAKVDHLPVDAHSKQWVDHIGRSDRLHPDFGPSYGAQPVPYGIPVTDVTSKHPRVTVHFTYASQSDHVRYPLGDDTTIEGGRHATGDRHAVIVDTTTCRLYETFDTRHTAHGWTAGSGATWRLRSNALRPSGWTSADAAGLPILPGLLRPDELKAGYVDHAIRFTAPVTSRHFLWPARHEAGSKNSLAYPPMGARFRLKKSFSLRGYGRDTKIVLRAMKTYGLILADNGSPWFFQGQASAHWPSYLIEQLKTIPAKDVVAVDESSLRASANSARVK